MSETASNGEPLYLKIKRELVAAIERGNYQHGRPFITQREVCERFGVSSTTAVRALNDLVVDGYLTRQRGVGSFVADARPPVSNGSTIACVIHGVGGVHIAEVIAGVEAVCAHHGYQMSLSNTQAQPALEDAALRRALDTRVAGVVLYPVEGQADIPSMQALREAGIPVVTVDRYRPDIPTDAVLADNYAVGNRLTHALIELGHTSIATLWSETDCTSVRDRLTGHIHAVREHGLPIRSDLIVLRTYERLPEPERLDTLKRMLDAPDAPTALLCGNGYVLTTAAHDLAALGIDTPGQVELASTDDAEPFELLPLAQVTAVLPSRDIGEQAAQLLLDRIRSKKPYDQARQIILPIEMRDRSAAKGYLRIVSTRQDAATPELLPANPSS